MYLEFQISTKAFIASLRRRAADANICGFPTINVPDVGEVIVDRFTLLEPSIDGKEVSQPVRVKVVSLAALEASSPDEADGPEFEFSIKLDLAVAQGPNGWEFRIAYDHVENETLPEAALDKVKEWFTDNRPFDRTVPLDLTPLATSLGLVQNAQLTAGLASNPEAVALRVDFSPTPNQADWAAFSANKFDVLLDLPKINFALYVDRDLLVPGIEKQAKQQLGGQLSVNSVSVNWLPQSWGARFHVDVDATAIDACKILMAEDVDVQVDIDIDIDVSMSADDMIRNHVAYSWDANNWDTLACMGALSFGLSPDPFIDVALFLVPAFGVWGPIYAATAFTPSIPAKPLCTQGEQTVTCSQALQMPQLFGPTTIRGLTSRANGLVFLGATTVPAGVESPVIASLAVQPVGFTVVGSCGSGLTIGGDGGIDIEYKPNDRGTICAVAPMPGSEDYTVTQDGENRINVTYPFGKVTEPCRILLQTNGGARIIDLGSPAPLTDELQQQMTVQLEQRKFICDHINTVEQVSWFDDVWWQQVGVARDVLFHVIMSGGNTGDDFTMTRVSGGDLIGTMTAPGTGGSELGSFVTLGEDKPVLTIPAGSRASSRLFLSGTVLRRVGSIQTPFAPTEVRFGFTSGALVVTIADEIQSQTFLLDQPRCPLFLRAGGPLRSFKAGGDARAVPAHMETRRDAVFVARSDGGGDVLDKSRKRPRVLASYVRRPWFVATDKRGRLVAHSVRNETVIYRVVAVHREQFSFDTPETKIKPRPPVNRPK